MNTVGVVVEDLIAELGIDSEELSRRMALLSLGEEDRKILRTLHHELTPHIQALVADFYRHLDRFPELQGGSGNPISDRGRLTQAQMEYLDSLTAGEYGMAYARERLRVGLTHQKIGLAPHCYLSAYRQYLEKILNHLCDEEDLDHEQLLRRINALLKIIFFDIELALDAYHYGNHAPFRASSEMLQLVMDNVSEGVVILNQSGEITGANRAAARIFGYAAKELHGRHIQNLIPVPFGTQDPDSHNPDAGTFFREVETVRKDGRLITVEIFLKKYADDNLDGHVGFVRDTTDRHNTENQLQQYRCIVEQTADTVIITDPDGVIVYVNPAFERTTGYRATEVIGKTAAVVKSGLHDDAYYAHLWNTIKSGRVFRDTLINRRKNGQLYYEDKTITPIHAETGMLVQYVSTGKDITKRIQSEQRLNFLADHDPLTGLLNRSAFDLRLHEAVTRVNRENRKLAIVCLNLDRFKMLNNALKCDQVDIVLRQVASRIDDICHAGDIVARIGGDEFVILSESLRRRQDVLLFLDEILDVFNYPFPVNEEKIHLSVSIGVCFSTPDTEETAQLLHQAEAAMRLAKKHGGSQYQFCNHEIQKPAGQQLKLETELRRALEQGEFRLLYQPQVNIHTRTLVGVEALLRWQHPRRGLLRPTDFISVLEETGLIVPVGKWVIEEACWQNRAWQTQGLPELNMAINISAAQVMRAGLISHVIQVLDQTGHAPHRLHLELTESVMMQDSRQVADVMWSLNQYQVRLVIDDFGTGYASIGYLKQYPFSIVKLDRSFIHDIDVNDQNAAIAISIIDLAHRLGMQVIAEGVETDGQLSFLEHQGCDLIQGYLVGRPLPAEEIATLTQRKF